MCIIAWLSYSDLTASVLDNIRVICLYLVHLHFCCLSKFILYQQSCQSFAHSHISIILRVNIAINDGYCECVMHGHPAQKCAERKYVFYVYLCHCDTIDLLKTDIGELETCSPVLVSSSAYAHLRFLILAQFTSSDWRHWWNFSVHFFKLYTMKEAQKVYWHSLHLPLKQKR